MPPSDSAVSASRAIDLGPIIFTPDHYCPSLRDTSAGSFDLHLEKLFDFFRLLPYPIQVFDRLGTAVMVNDAFLRMYEIESAAAYCGRYNIFKDDRAIAAGTIPVIERIFKGETAHFPCAYGSGYPNYSGAGSSRREHIYSSAVFIPVSGPDGGVSHIISIRTDLTEYKKTEEQLRSSEERLRALLEGSSDMIQVLDEHGNIVYVSQSMEKILGYNPRLPLGEPAFKIIHPDDLSGITASFARLLADPATPLKVTCRCLHSNGSWRHVEAWAKNHLSNPAINGIVLNIRDISDHVAAQELIETSEAKFRGIVEQSRDGITIIDQTGTVIIYNRAQEQITGIPAEEALGQKIWDLQYRCMTSAHKARAPIKRFKAMYREFLKSGKSPWLDSVFDSELVRTDGTRLNVQTLLFQLRINNTVAYASFNRDVTAQKKAQQELLRRETELEERAALLQQKNIALRELMGQVELEKKRSGEQFQANIDQLVLPVLQRLKARCCEADRVYVDMLEENLREVTSGLGVELLGRMNRLTQREIEMCTMIKQGITSKEIGNLLHISARTVETHRNRIRRKLNIGDSAVNLTTYLKSNMTARSVLNAPAT